MSNWNLFSPEFWEPPTVVATEVRASGAAAGVRAGVQAVQVNDAARAAARQDTIHVADRRGAVRE